MSSIFKKNEHKAPKPNSMIRSISGTSYGDDVNTLPTLVTPPKGRARKSPKASRVSAAGRFDLATMPISSGSSASYFPLDYRPTNTTADCTSLLMRAFCNRDSNGSLSILTSTNLGMERHIRETSLLSHNSIRMDNPPAIFISDVDSDATLHKNLGMTESTKYRAIPATKPPPDSPAAIQEGGFGSLMGVSMAIMQGRT